MHERPRDRTWPEPPALPIDAVRPAFALARAAGRRLVITAPTGSGKSTLVPLWCAAEGKRVLVVEPRRVACRSLARHVAELMGEELGKGVGYAVRHEPNFGGESRVVFATPGTVLRMLQPDSGGPSLRDRWDTLVLDEFHERQLDTDLLLAFAMAMGLEDLIVMSATLEAERLGVHLGAEVIEGHGRQYPVTVEHDEGPSVPSVQHLEARVHDAVQRAVGYAGDILVFLPGRGEIQSCADVLRRQSSLQALEVLPLHGALPPEEQDRPFAPSARRRIILSTNVAETSVTLPGVGVVVDAGLVRQTRYHRGSSALRLVPIAQDSAEQRRGRAGRLRPGHCIRLWSQAARLDAVTPPEMLREELTDAVLTVACCGLDLRTLELLDPPRHYAVDAAVDELERLGCLDGRGQITPIGRAVARLPVHPMLGRMLLAAAALPVGDPGHAPVQDAIDLVAALSSGRSILLTGQGGLSEERMEWMGPRCEATQLILALRFGKAGRDALRAPALVEARKLAEQLRRLMGVRGQKPTAVDREALVRAFVTADPRTAFAQRKRNTAYSNEGMEVRPGRDSLIDPACEAVVVADIHTDKDRSGRVTHFASCAIPTTLRLFGELGLGTEVMDQPRRERGRIVCVVRRVLAGHTLGERTTVPTGAMAREALEVLLLRGSVLRTTIERSKQDIAWWNLYRRWAELSGGEDVELEAWVRERIDAIGFSAGDELALVIEDDFVFQWPVAIPTWDREKFERDFPLEVHLGDVVYAPEYATGRRIVTLVQIQGSSKKNPPLHYLPHWPGWTIQVKRGNAISLLRG